MPNDAAADKSGSAKHCDGGLARHPSHLAPHPRRAVLHFGRAPPYAFRRILDTKSPRIGGPDASPRRKPITCHKRNQNRIASESLRMR